MKKLIILVILILIIPSTAFAMTEKDIQVMQYDAEVVEILAKIVYAEANGVESEAEQQAVIWCILNRVDAGWGTLKEVATAPHQFAYNARDMSRLKYRNMVREVLELWRTDGERALPSDYLYFAGRNGHNYFRKSYGSTEYWRFEDGD